MKSVNRNKSLRKTYSNTANGEQTVLAVYQVKGALSQIAKMKKLLAAKTALA